MLFNVVFYSGLAGIVTILGILSVLYKEKLVKKYSKHLIAVATGILLGVSFFDLLPEAIEHNPNSLIIVLGGMVVFYLLENWVVIHICKEEDCKKHRFSTMTIIGLGIHSLIDGVAIGASFEASAALGLITTIAVISHELPEGIITSSLMFTSNFDKKRGILYSFAVALATPVGAVLTFLFLNNLSEMVLGALLALAAGSFIYISAADLIPQTHEESNRKIGFIVLLGIAISYMISMFAH